MKKLLLLWLLVIPYLLSAQNYHHYLRAADSLAQKKQYQEAGLAFDKAFAIKEGNSTHFYNAACNWSLAGDKKKALSYLKQSVNKNYLDLAWMQQDSDLKPLHTEKAWPGIQKQVEKNIREMKARTFTKTEKLELLEAVASTIEAQHFSEEQGREIGKNLLEEFQKGTFGNETTNRKFTNAVTTYLRANTKDLHFYFGLDNDFWAEPQKQQQKPAAPAKVHNLNYGFEEVRILPGNVGYLKWNTCISGQEAFAKAAAIMTFLSDSKAIIIDLSENGGGDGNMGTFLGTYFLGPDYPVTAGECRNKKFDTEKTKSYVPGKLLKDIPLYIIISGKTGSAAEYFAHYMKEEKRATILGAKSAGAAHPAVMISLPYKTVLQVPECRLWSYSTNLDFEAIGVIPHTNLQTTDWPKETLDIVNAKLLNAQ